MRPGSYLVPGRLACPALSPAFICARCRTQETPAPRRKFSSATSRASPPAPPPPSGLVALSSRRLISLSGPDAPKFLQGIITQNILAPQAGGGNKVREDGLYGAFLTATGRVLHDVFVYPDSRRPASGAETTTTTGKPGESFLVEVDAGEAARLERHIKRYKLRARFAVRLLDEGEATVWHGWDGDGVRAALDAPEDPDRLAHLRDPRAPGMGWRMIEAGARPPRVDLPLVADEEAYRVRRYLLGVPEGQGELLREAALPLEANLDVMGGVDFRKGCYVGQELTIRTKHRGVVRKRVLPVMLYADDDGSSGPPERLEYRPAVVASGGAEAEKEGVVVVDAGAMPPEASIGRAGRKGRSAGKWLRGVGNIGLGLCRLETMTDVVLPGETAASVFNPADEFVIEQPPGEDGTGGFKVKVKAFVPEWLRQSLDQQNAGH